MKQESRFSLNLTNSGNLAFVIVVGASYVSAASALLYSGRSLPPVELFALVGLGCSYLFVGTYGFTVCRRSKRPSSVVVYFTLQLLTAVILIKLRGSAGELSLILFPLAAQSALVLSLGWMVAVCILIYSTLVSPLILSNRWIDAVAIALAYGTGIVFVVVFTRVAVSEREARSELAEANNRLLESARQIEELATTKERNRLAREIHDSIGHYLTVINVQIGAAQAIFSQDTERALEHLSKARTSTQEGLAEIRRSVAALRASPAESRPLREGLAKLAEQWKVTGVDAGFTVLGTPRPLTPQYDLTIYRAAQEALTNVGKHARASKVEIALDYRKDGSVGLRVTDDGIGSDDPRQGFGLLGVRERVQLLGGEVCVRSEEGNGFTLELDLPAWT